VHYPELEKVLHRLAPRPWLMIHGGADNYIKPEMARELFSYAGAPKEFWLVDKAKHNQAMQTANGEYKRRVLAFFDKHWRQGVFPDPGRETSAEHRTIPATHARLTRAAWR
jgi:hypothetical protein